MVAGHLLVIPFGVNLADAGAAGQPVQTMASKDTVDGRIRHADRVVVRGDNYDGRLSGNYDGR